MNIALVIERMDASRGGRERSVAQVAAALTRRGHQVTVLCQSGQAGGEGLAVRPLGVRGRTRAGRLANFVADVQAIIAAREFDIVHATLPVPGADVYQPRGGTVPAQRAASVRRRWVFGGLIAALDHLFNPHRRRMEKYEREVMADQRTLCLAVSEMVAEEFARYYGRRENARVIYNAVEVPAPDDPIRAQWRAERRKELGIGPDAFVFLTAARNFALKGIAQWMLAFNAWSRDGAAKPEAHVVIVGGDDVKPTEEWPGSRHYNPCVHLVGYSDDIFQWYAAADAVALLSWYDPCSRVVLEAVRWGIPSVTTVFNGAAELLARGAGIVVASPWDMTGVVAAIEKLADPARRREMSAACRDVADLASMERHIDQLLDAYAGVLAAKERRSQEEGPA